MDYQPNELGGWHVGDLADIETLGRVRVEELKPPSTIVVRVSSGATCKVGWKVLQRVQRGGERVQ